MNVPKRRAYRLVWRLYDHVFDHTNDCIRLLVPGQDLSHCILKSKKLFCGLVDDKCERVAREITREITAAFKLPSYRFSKLMAYAVVWKINCKIRVLALPGESSVAVPYLRGRAAGYGHFYDGVLAYEFIPHGVEVLANIGGRQIDIDESIAVVANGAVFGKLNLAEHHDRADDECYRNCELQHDQHLSGDRCQPAYAKCSFQHLDWLER